VSTGEVVKYDNFPSKFAHSTPVDVWLPPGYHPKQKYAVLYIHAGQMLFDSAHTRKRKELQADEAAT
jgi:enterochelin esterase-like enzyme